VLRWISELRPVQLEISGADLLAAGLPEGPALGRALDETLNRKLDGLVSGRQAELETALLLAREHAQ
jgi:tRNA nucleotidyltransferase (CCA-adding enzyme)